MSYLNKIVHAIKKLRVGHCIIVLLVIVFLLYLIVPSISAKAHLAILEAVLVAAIIIIGGLNLRK
jgi:uncharacterized BrkB/YihY/UPF0761 family membrane protein